MDGDGIKDKAALTVQVRFTTKQQQYAVPDYPYAIAATVGSDELNSLVNRVLIDDGLIEKPKVFDFLIGGEFLRGTLEELILRHEAIKANLAGVEIGENKVPGVGVEEIVDVEYVESCPPPEPQQFLMHDDWVSAVDAIEKWILTGSYDNTLHLWSSKGTHKQAFAAHMGPVKSVCWISHDENSALFASGSQDQTIMIWDWNYATNNVTCKWILRGHERSVEALKSDAAETMLASGSWDGQLKVWSSSPGVDKRDVKILEAEAADAVTGAEKVKTRTPIMTLSGHKECISALDWSTDNELITASWDHTIKVWDVEMGGIKSELAGQKAFFSLSWSPLNHTVITSSADRHIRLYDPRTNEGSLVKATFTSHSAWVPSVNWSKTDENLFISGSHDKLMKLWDRRSPRAPLYNMTGHTDNVLCTSWSNPEFMMSGGSDNSLRVFRFKGEIP